MALPQTEQEWVTYLALRHDVERAELEAYDRYYEGTQPLSYMHPEILREVSDRISPVILFWPQLVVDSVDERLDGEGFRLPAADEDDDDLWRVWQANDLDVGSQQAHVDALVMRRAYVSVGSNEDDPDTPLITPESPLEVFADIDPRTRKIRAALKRVAESDAGSSTGLTVYSTLYLPDVTVWYEGNQEVDRDEHNLGCVPVVPILNRARLHASTRGRYRRDDGTGSFVVESRGAVRYGRSELDAVIPLSDAACKLATDMMVGAEFVALPLRGLFGIGPSDLQDSAGNSLTALQAIMGRLFTVADTEAKAFEFSAARLDNFAGALDSLSKLVASIAGLPPHYLGSATDNPASADAIRSSEARLVKRAERKQRAFGAAWEQVMRLARRIQTGEWDPDLLRLEMRWADAATPTVAQRADAAVKLHAEGITTTRQAREDIGYTDAQIRRMEDDEAAQGDRLLGIKPLPPPDQPRMPMPMDMPPPAQ